MDGGEEGGEVRDVVKHEVGHDEIEAAGSPWVGCLGEGVGGEERVVWVGEESTDWVHVLGGVGLGEFGGDYLSQQCQPLDYCLGRVQGSSGAA